MLQAEGARADSYTMKWRPIYPAAALFAALLLPLPSFAQHTDYERRIKIPLWAELDANPASEDAADTAAEPFNYSVKRVKAISEFLINGMACGWTFAYTPSDKLRNVSEQLELDEINTAASYGGTVVYSKPWIENNHVNVWVELERTPQMVWNYNLWERITQQTVHGRGRGKIARGFEGITDAARDAVKDALRTHYRGIIKNKPKEIRGKLLIRKAPLLGLDAGHYTLELDFFLETDKIVKYTKF